jgi:hypothetical protein
MRGQELERQKLALSKKESELAVVRSELTKAQKLTHFYENAVDAKVDKAVKAYKEARADQKAKAVELRLAKLEYEAAKPELDSTNGKVEKLEADLANPAVSLADLRKERDELKVSQLSQRSNEQMAQNRIRKAVLEATAEKDKELKKLEIRLEETTAAKDEELAMLKNSLGDAIEVQHKLYSDNQRLNKANEALEEKLSVLAEVQVHLEKEKEGKPAKIQVAPEETTAGLKKQLDIANSKVKGLEELLAVYIKHT